MKKLVIPLALTLCCAPLVSRIIGTNTYEYDDDGQYQPGGAALTGPIRSIDVGWVGGSVTVLRHADATVTFSETSRRELTDEILLRYWLDGDTLRIRFAQRGANIAQLEKQLVLCLPQGFALDDLCISSASAAIHMNDIAAETAAICATSGAITLDGCTFAQRATISSTSGAIDLQYCALPRHSEISATSGTITGLLTGPAEQLTLNSTSGRIDIFCGNVDLLTANAVSGKILLSADAIELLKINTTSGAIDILQREQPGSGTLSSVSGKIALHIPEGAGCTVETSSVSGRIRCEHAAQVIGKRYVIGSGAGLYRISTVSGGILIDK